MSKIVPEVLTEEEQDALRAEARQIMETDGLSQMQAAEEAGIPYGTFTPWLGGTYKGNTTDKAIAVRRWLETRRERAHTVSILPVAPAFVTTPTGANILDLLAFAQTAPDFAVVVGGPGIGKTTAIEEYRKRNSNVFVVTAEPCLASPNNMLSALADVMGIVEKRAAWVSRAICNRVQSAAALIIIDEAQHLTPQALDQLRTIHDKARVGIAVAGNETVFARLRGGGEARGAQFAQLYSRVGMRLNQPNSRAKDICALIEAWDVKGKQEIDLLKLIANKPGSLRNMTKTIRLSHMLASGSGEAISEKHIRLAWRQLSSLPLETAA